MTDQAATAGIHHLGLTVADLDTTLAFFTDCLGWKQVGGRPEYPSAFVSDGSVMLTLWQAKADEPAAFDRSANVGLHHVALKVNGLADLDALFTKVSQYPGVRVEFAPESLGDGPMVHCMIFEPGGIRIELACSPE